MHKQRLIGFGIACAFLLGSISCSSDDSASFIMDDTVVMEDEIIDPTDTITDPMDDGPLTIDGELGMVEIYNSDRLSNDLILVNDARNNQVYIMDRLASLLHQWELSNNIGNDVFLQSDGRLLACLESDSPQIPFGGQGGRLQFVDKDGNIDWDFIYSTPQAETHHDAELLPNGNVIVLVWELKSAEESLEAGFMLDAQVYPEAVIEINPNTDEIVWEWHAWDHLVQDFDNTKSNFGSISENLQLIDINYSLEETGEFQNVEGDIMHANALAYDPVNDVIFVSVNFYSEIWAIDHSTTTEQAASSSGGNYGKGGDLIYRFGNPDTYNNLQGKRLFYNQHHPLPLTGADQGKMLIFSNGNNNSQSTIYELQLPAIYDMGVGLDNEPSITWQFSDPELYAPRVSGAVPLSNGNILITEGDFGLWEVTRDKEVVWKFEGDGFYWRSYAYSIDAPEIAAIGLTF